MQPWNSSGQNFGVASLSLLQGIFPTQGLNPGLVRCRWILYQLSYRGSPLNSVGTPQTLCNTKSQLVCCVLRGQCQEAQDTLGKKFTMSMQTLLFVYFLSPLLDIIPNLHLLYIWALTFSYRFIFIYLTYFSKSLLSEELIIIFTMNSQKLHGFPDSSVGKKKKKSTCNAGDLGLIPGLGRSPGEGKGYPLQYSGLENSVGLQRVGHD